MPDGAGLPSSAASVGGAGTGAFGSWLRSQRKARDLTQDALGAKLGCTGDMIRKIETGRAQPSRSLAERLAISLDIVSSARPAFVAWARGVPGAAPPVPAPVSTRGDRAEYPRPTAGFVGREPHLAAAAALLRRVDPALITLTGPGGVGKTRLAQEIVAANAGLFADGALFVPLAPLGDPRLVVPTIVGALGVREVADRPLLESLQEALKSRHLLLVLDNFEHVLTAAPMLGDLVAAAPMLKIVVTSRETLRLPEEYVFPVSPLRVPDLSRPPDPERLAAYEAVQLFVERARAANSQREPAFVLTPENALPVATICTMLQGLPLAIELAAARTRLLPPDALLERLAGAYGYTPLQLLGTSSPDRIDRHKTLRTAITWSHDLLASDERMVFRRLAVFAGGCTLEAFEQLAAGELPGLHGLDGLESLLDKSLLWQDMGPGGQGRFLMLETVREFALEALAASGEEELLRNRHAAYYLALAESVGPQVRGAEQATGLARLAPELDNLRAAQEWAMKKKMVESALRFAATLWPFWLVRGYLTEGRRRLEAALANGNDAPSVLRAAALHGAGVLAAEMGDLARSRVCFDESLTLRRELGDAVGVASALNSLGNVALYQDDHPSAGAFYQQASVEFRALGNRSGLALALANLCGSLIMQGYYGEAAKVGAESLALARELGLKATIVNVLDNLGLAAQFQGDYPKAVQAYTEEQALAAELGYRKFLSSALQHLGVIARQTGDYPRAEEYVTQSLAIARELADRRNVMSNLGDLAMVALQRGDAAGATEFFRESLALSREVGDRRNLRQCLEGLAALAAHDGRAVRAARLYGAAATLQSALKEPRQRADQLWYEEEVRAARSELAAVAWEAAWESGAAWNREQMLAYALEERPEPSLSPDYASPPEQQNAAEPLHDLTSRELEVLRLVARGLTNEEVAKQLYLSPHTVQAHLRSIYSKLGGTNRLGATRFAIEHDLV
jgi:predicted ATPase/DNA-binding CsgD family transcriptional regulator/transcriptional regulator with XRE-family HTH domain